MARKWHEVTPGCMVFDAGQCRQLQDGKLAGPASHLGQEEMYQVRDLLYLLSRGCIPEDAEGFFEANLDYCKGCGICAHECWPGAIVMVEEEV